MYLQLALVEMITNAIEHGNLEIDGTVKAALRSEDERSYLKLIEERKQQLPYKDRQVTVEMILSREQALYRVTDEGPGFDYQQVLNTPIPVSVSPSGRGVVLTQKLYADQLLYNAKGNQMTLIKKPAITPASSSSEKMNAP